MKGMKRRLDVEMMRRLVRRRLMMRMMMIILFNDSDYDNGVGSGC